jgi:hypothetical protein
MGGACAPDQQEGTFLSNLVFGQEEELGDV